MTGSGQAPLHRHKSYNFKDWSLTSHGRGIVNNPQEFWEFFENIATKWQDKKDYVLYPSGINGTFTSKGKILGFLAFSKFLRFSSFLTFSKFLRFSGYKGWDLNNLPSEMKKYITEKKEGITTTFLYVGGYASHFNIHIEEDGLGSINLLHNVSKVSFNRNNNSNYNQSSLLFQIEGTSPKYWYHIKPEDQMKLEYYLKALHPELFENCQNYLAHRGIMLHPMVFQTIGIKLFQGEQLPGWYTIIWPGVYHFGFNKGKNVAEVSFYHFPYYLSKYKYHLTFFTGSCICT